MEWRKGEQAAQSMVVLSYLSRNSREDIDEMITSLIFVNMSRKIRCMTALMMDFCSCKCSCKNLLVYSS